MTGKPVLFLARSLDRGGAERQLVTLANGLVNKGHQVAVAVFYGGGAFEAELHEAGVRVINLNKQGRWDVLPFLLRLLWMVRNECPAILHGYLAVANLLAVTVKPFLPNTLVVWGIRASNMELSRYDWLARLTDFCEPKLSGFADLIIANSQAGKCYAVERGFPIHKMVVIPNGIDTARFQFQSEGRRKLRSAWNVGDSDILIGLAARLDPMKDHPTFLQAANLIAAQRQDVRFVSIGGGAPDYTEKLKRQADALGLSHKLIWAGARDDMPSVYSALDIAVSSSCFGEGFSNTIAEAMACGIPAVVTDVGDSAWIVGDAGFVVPCSDPQSLMNGFMQLIVLSGEQRKALGERARQRIVLQFSVEALVSATEKALEL